MTSKLYNTVASQTDLPLNSVAPLAYMERAKERIAGIENMLDSAVEDLIELDPEGIEEVNDVKRALIPYKNCIRDGTLTVQDCVDLKVFAFELVFGFDSD